MRREINLDGGEITVLKTLGLSGSQMYGKLLLDRLKDMETAEFIDTLNGLLDLGYILSNKVNLRLREDVERAFFRVNSAYAHELRDALNPSRRRREQQDQGRRRRRS
jgi:hypothetical protein